MRGWTGRSGTHQRLGVLCLVVILLAGLSLPRFGLVWHDHEDPDEEHDYHQLLRLLESSQASHPVHHPHIRSDLRSHHQLWVHGMRIRGKRVLSACTGDDLGMGSRCAMGQAKPGPFPASSETP